jgi:hypothetical protein
MVQHLCRKTVNSAGKEAKRAIYAEIRQKPGFDLGFVNYSLFYPQ